MLELGLILALSTSLHAGFMVFGRSALIQREKSVLDTYACIMDLCYFIL